MLTEPEFPVSGMSRLALDLRKACSPVPAYPGQPHPRRTAPIRLSVAETARLTPLAVDRAAGFLTRARLAFKLRWSVVTTTRPVWQRRQPDPRRPEGGDST
jgi:hypothetical protein